MANNIDLAALRAAAAAATQSEWVIAVGQQGDAYIYAGDAVVCSVGNNNTRPSQQTSDALYIVAAQPSVVVALVAEVTALRERLAETRDPVGVWFTRQITDVIDTQLRLEYGFGTAAVIETQEPPVFWYAFTANDDHIEDQRADSIADAKRAAEAWLREHGYDGDGGRGAEAGEDSKD